MNDKNPLTSDLEIQIDADPLFGSADEVVERYTRCVICGSHLHFSHIADFQQNTTQETAKCPECGIRVRRVIHKLQ